MATQLNQNTTDLQSILDAVNALPDAGSVIGISTAAGMSAVLTEANVGKAYKFTGTTDDTYTNGDIYVVEVSS